jgi:hypothetical protein
MALNIKPIEDFKPTEKKVFAFLTIDGIQRILGTTPIDEIRYKTDYDLMEYKDFEMDKPQVYQLVLDLFREKFDKAYQNPNMWITDFKCGVQNGGIPIRWNRQSIKKGFQYIEDNKVFFVDCLQEQSIIKLDVLSLINGLINEFSEVYLLTFGDFKTYNPQLTTSEHIRTAMRQDALYYKGKGNIYKGLKRLFAFLRMDEAKNKTKIKSLLDLFNSPIGRLATLKSDLEEIELLLSQKFRPVPKEVIKRNLKYVYENVADEFKPSIEPLLKLSSISSLKSGIYSVMGQMNKTIQKNTKAYLEEAKNKNLFNI